MIFHYHPSSFGLSNGYIIGPDNGGDAVFIDPGNFDTSILNVIEESKLYIRSILLTHSHESHIKGINTILKIYDAEIYSYRQSILDFQAHKIRDFMTIDCNGFEFEVFETPGHTGDSLMFRYKKLLFSGDTLLAGSIGSAPDEYARRLIISSIKEKILTIGDNLFIFPGHGPPTSLDIERKFNAALKEEV
jgi:hydroxyacylglutathione hydrolase